MSRTFVYTLTMLWVSFGLCCVEIQDPGFISPSKDLPQGTALTVFRNPPAYTFSVNPVQLLFSYNDYMIGSYNSMPLQVVPSYAGGGYFMTYHGQRSVTGLRRVFYSYLNSAGIPLNSAETTESELREGYPSLSLLPLSNKPVYAWHSDRDDDTYLETTFVSDAFISGIAGLINEDQIIVENPISVTAPNGTITTDNEFIWPSTAAGPSPFTGKQRLYVLTRNNSEYSTQPSENVYIRFTDISTDDIEMGTPLLWNTAHFTIPEMDQWHVDDLVRRPFGSIVCDDTGNLYYCGYHIAYHPESNDQIQEPELDIWKCTNYGEGTWSRTSMFSNLPSWNPPALPNGTAGYFTNESGIPYADTELKWVIVNSSHLNATMDDNGKIHVPGIWALQNSDGSYYHDLQVIKEYVFDTGAAQSMEIRDIYPQTSVLNSYDEYYQPWHLEAPWGVVDGWHEDGQGSFVPDMATIWPFGFWDDTAYTDAMMFHFNNVKITQGNDQHMMACVWQDSQKARWYNAFDDSDYAAHAMIPDTFISVSPDNGSFWSEPIVLNSLNTPELSGLRPQWVYPANKVIYVGQSGTQKIGKLGLLFYSDYDWYCSNMTPPVPVTNPGGKVMFMELQITFPSSPYFPEVDDPVPSFPSGYYPAPIDVAITCPTWDASIYYTLDGSIPTTSSVLYNDPVHIDHNCTLRVRAFHYAGGASRVVTRAYDIAVANPEDPSVPIVTGISRLYPNPFSDIITIQLGIREANQDYELSVYNLKGERVYRLQGKGTGMLDLSWDGISSDGNKLPRGIYILSFKSGTTTQVRKLTLF